MHGRPTPRLYSPDPKAARIAALSEEYLYASKARKEEIGEIIAAMIAGDVVAL